VQTLTDGERDRRHDQADEGELRADSDRLLEVLLLVDVLDEAQDCGVDPAGGPR
jgi:hypothetical protein